LLEAKIDHGRHNRPAGPPPAATPIPLRPAVNQAVARARVELLEYLDVPGGAQIKVQWKGDNRVQGTEVIDFLIQMGAIRDFDPLGSPVSYVNSQGQSVHTVSFTLRAKG
jgi:hypothetical protein